MQHDPSADFRTLWTTADGDVEIIDQRLLPHTFKVIRLQTYQDAVEAITSMQVRGAPLIGATAAYGIYLALREQRATQQSGALLSRAIAELKASRPTAVNLFWAIERMQTALQNTSDPVQTAWSEAAQIVADDIATCHAIGTHGLPLLQQLSAAKQGQRLNILTHCNAGMLGCIQWGTATSPIYQAAQQGMDLHVWVDETRPRNQGANLTAYELSRFGIPHSLITDNTGGHLMQHGEVDLVLVGTDRTTRCGDVANKIGTYLKALAAHDNKIPFYVALPSTSIDWSLRDGLREIPIEQRDGDEVKYVYGQSRASGELDSVLICPRTTAAINYGFDVTPARLITALITERGVCPASEAGLLTLFPEQ